MNAQAQTPIYIAFYTINTPYADEIRTLQESLEKHSLPYDIEAIPSFGSWQENTKYKAIFIQNMLFKHAGRAVVYLDADAVIKKRPVLFDELDCDIAAHYYTNSMRDDKELLSGTLYVGATKNAKKLVELWRCINYEYPDRWEQKNLAIALRFMPELKIVDLPPSYCQIYDLMRDCGDPVIEHFQASRRHKQIIDENKAEG